MSSFNYLRGPNSPFGDKVSEDNALAQQARSIASAKREARTALGLLNERMAEIVDERSMPAHWEDIAEVADLLKQRAERIARIDR